MTSPRPSPLLWTILALQILIIAALVYLFLGGTPHGGSLPAGLSTPPGASSGPGVSGSAELPPPSSSPSPALDGRPSAGQPAAPSAATPSPDPAPLLAIPFPASPSPFFRPRPLSPFHGDFARAMAQAQALLDATAADLFSPDPAWSDLPPTPTCNLSASPDAFSLSIALPALAPSNLSVRLDGRLLSVESSAETSSPSGASSSSFAYRTLLPGPVPPDAVPTVSATPDGVRIDVPRFTENPQPKGNP